MLTDTVPIFSQRNLFSTALRRKPFEFFLFIMVVIFSNLNLEIYLIQLLQSLGSPIIRLPIKNSLAVARLCFPGTLLTLLDTSQVPALRVDGITHSDLIVRVIQKDLSTNRGSTPQSSSGREFKRSDGVKLLVNCSCKKKESIKMGMGNRNLSENQATFYPPSLTPIFMGAYPPTKVGGSTYEGGTVSYFQNYRNETLSRFMMPPHEWGLQSTPYSPRPDLVAAAKVRDYNKALSVPRNNITTIDPDRMREIDDLYKVKDVLGVQMHRQQYKDHTGSLHPLTFFKADEYAFQCSPELVPSYLFKYPESYTEYKRPPVVPLTYERISKTPYMPDLAFPGIYSSDNCIAYKR